MSNAAWMKGAKIMITLKHAETVTAVLFVAGLGQYGITTHAQNATPTCRPAQVIPLTGPEPPPKLVDDAPWHWADASGTPLILRGLPPGPHKVLVELVDPNHQVIDKGSVSFDVPAKPATPASR